jgi:hypothetical protein
VPLPVVLVEIAPLDPPAELASTLVTACSQAMRTADCVLADEALEHETWGIAIVSWRDEAETRAWVEVGQRGMERDHWRSRRVRFSADDSREERWKTVGFTIATLAEKRDESGEPTSAGPQPEVTPESDEPPAPAGDEATAVPAMASPPPAESPEQRAPVWIGVAVIAGSGLENGTLRWGGSARASASPISLPAFATVSVRAALGEHRDSVSARWVGGTLGLGAFTSLGPLRADLRAELLFENMHAAVADSATGRSDDGSQWTNGIVVGTQAGWPAEGPVAITLGAEAWRLRKGVGVWVGDSRETGWPVWGWSLAAGAEWRIP